MDHLRDLMETMFCGVVALTKAVIPHMRAQGGARLHRSPEIDAYADTVGRTRAFVDSGDGPQPGDPRRAAAAIVAALDAPDAPLHLALGADAVEAIRRPQQQRRADLESWEQVSRDTALDEAAA